MVYCGKPSMGCRTCRARRIKCDETRPVCNQCIKSRRHCSGYRSDFDILHRDETQATATRAKKQAAKKAAKRAAENGGTLIDFVSESAPANAVKKEYSRLPAATASGSSSPTSLSPTSTALTAASSASTSPLEATFPIAPPAMPLDQHATHYFASHFIMLPGQFGKRYGHLDYLIPLFQTETDPNSAFQLAYSACSYAAMSTRKTAQNTDLVRSAYIQQGKAIRAVHQALQDPVRCKADATLATVLLLCFFEKITASKEVGLLAWRTHIEGAIHIVRERGREMSQGNYSMLLFNAVRTQIVTRTLSSGQAPPMGVNWWTPESNLVDPFGARFQRFALEVSDLRAEVTRLMAILPRNEDGINIMLEMLRKIQDLDHHMAGWLDSLPPEYQPSILYWEDGVSSGKGLKDAPVFPGRVDIYHDMVTASFRNSMRSSRIILASLLIRVAAWICSPADYRATPEYATAVRTIKSNTADLISSVPFMLGTYTQNQVFSGVNSGSFACGTDLQTKMVGGLFISWPLSTVRTCDFSTDDQREWAIGRLNFIAQELGIRYASSLAAARIRFPSMLISRDGTLSSQDPLKDIKATLSSKKAISIR